MPDSEMVSVYHRMWVREKRMKYNLVDDTGEGGINVAGSGEPL